MSQNFETLNLEKTEKAFIKKIYWRKNKLGKNNIPPLGTFISLRLVFL